MDALGFESLEMSQFLPHARVPFSYLRAPCHGLAHVMVPLPAKEKQPTN
jgi:hypothetical protein